MMQPHTRFGNPFSPHYHLVCPACGSVFGDNGFRLSCSGDHVPALLRTQYTSKTLECNEEEAGFFRYRCWLPARKAVPHASGSVTFQSQALSTALRLPHLWIAFSGYWPERAATLETATFKELEAFGVLSRIPPESSRVLVVASAGNTAAAFARACSDSNIPCLIVLPESGLKKMVFAAPLHAWVKIICLTGSAAYADAIALAERISEQDGFVGEGGVKNVGRRDGMATVMLNAVETIGRLPDYYFQAIGSGAGAIAAHEAAKRLITDSRFGFKLPRLMLSQNLPFAPIYDSWKRLSRNFVEIDPERARDLSSKILATVLSNQRPPYSVVGGVCDVLSESRGEMFAIHNERVLEALELFEKCEGIDIEPAAGVALASLIEAVDTGQVPREAGVLLHITGGGARKRAKDKKLQIATPDRCLSLAEVASDGVVADACALFGAPRAYEPAPA